MKHVLPWLLTLGLSAPASAGEAAVLSVNSAYPLEETVSRLRSGLAGHGYRVLREEEYAGTPARALYFCDFDRLKEAYARDRRLGYRMPCQITVAPQGRNVLVSVPNPTFAGTVENPGAASLCTDVRESLTEVLAEVAP